METIIVVLEVIIIVLLLAFGSFFAYHLHRHIGFVAKDWEWRQQLGKTLVATAHQRRENHLEIMKQFKGQSYEGQFGGLDIHTNPNIPPGSGPVPVP